MITQDDINIFTEMGELTSSTDDDEAPAYDLSLAEDVLVEVLFDIAWANGVGHDAIAFESITVLSGDTQGAASFEYSEGGCLDYMLIETVDQYDFINGEGWYVFEDVSVTYTRGDGWMTDDDAEIDYKSIRPATPDEIAQA